MTNTTSDDYRRALPPTTAQLFGEDLGPDLFTDQPLVPSKRSSAVRHAQRRITQEGQAAEDRDLAQLAAVAHEQAQDEALEKAQALIRAGQKVPYRTRIAAMAALRRRGVPVPSADQLAAQARRTVPWQDQDDQWGRRSA